jgi:hypothetical protein
VTNVEAVEFATLEWVDWINNRRFLEPISNVPPVEVEQRYQAMLEQPAMAACFKPNGLRQTRGGSARGISGFLTRQVSRERHPSASAAALGTNNTDPCLLFLIIGCRNMADGVPHEAHCRSRTA